MLHPAPPVSRDCPCGDRSLLAGLCLACIRREHDDARRALVEAETALMHGTGTARAVNELRAAFKRWDALAYEAAGRDDDDLENVIGDARFDQERDAASE